MKQSISKDGTKELLREAIGEAIEKKKEMFYELIKEAMENVSLINAIREGEKTKSVKRDDIFKILEN